MLGALLGSLYLINCGTNEWTEVSFWDGVVLGTTLGAIEGILIGKSDRIELGFSVIEKQDVQPSPICNHLSSL